ncbi:Ca2+-binding RTX toxin-like protein [Actinoplanes octamycinicus]|uniref:Ca2+-binding RTX toxin-like protein n=1 Tax=Actinoplanes octamycinicus TaxID=135948 RepID=A0A7W7GUZ7_9ACTN|nr:calcium-binding protein [Actinoplanes octamycinicus]MBB4738717.1 Ca2+-binding RTX toxin-like protein [Actinoplanes octamycinicus]GIE61450.1 hypothetical protein Aoc01nite_68520 [Actinoplanes octamycinicus]
MRHHTRLAALGLALVTTASVAAVGSPAQAASAGTASVTATTKVRYAAAKGARSKVVLTRSGNTITIDDVVAIKPGKGCKKVDRTKVRCTTRKAPTRLQVYTYDRGDSIVNDTDVRMTASAGTGNDRVYGGSRGDRIAGDDGADKLYGRGGNDNLNGWDGNDLVHGGDGNDSIEESSSKRSGSDVLHGDRGDDYIDGETGNDKLYGDDGSDLIFGGPGLDRLEGGYGPDTLQGDDCSRGAGFGPCVAADVLLGGPDVDTVSYSDSDAPLVVDLDGARGDDGRSGEHDTVGADVENLGGGTKNDRLTGNGAANYIHGGRGGNDTIHGGAGDDQLSGGVGRDGLYGDAGDDVLLGSDDDGAEAADWLDGGVNGDAGDQCVATRRDTLRGCER